MKFELTILGSNSAKPTFDRYPSAQVLNIHDQLFLIDCGEGTQIQLHQYHIKRNRINHIFISHLHGDHCFGLFGLLTTASLNNRTEPLHLHSPSGLEEMLEVTFRNTGSYINYPIHYHVIDTKLNECIFENDVVEVYSLPLIHRIATSGFLFKEKKSPDSIRPEKIQAYDIPYSEIDKIKQGADFRLKTGKVVPHSELTAPAPTPRSFAYCSDTAFNESLVPLIRDVDLLYHETTFLHALKESASITKHSTALEAATMAKKANAGQLITGHYSTRYRDLQPILEEAKTVFPNTILGEDGLVVSVPQKSK